MKKTGIKRIVWTTLMLVLGLVVAAQAAPFALQTGPVYIQFNNLEQIDTSLQNGIDVPGPYGTAGNWGVFNVSSIQAGGVATLHEDISGGPVYFFDDGPGDFLNQGQVTGIFYDIQLTSGTKATGGIMDLFWFDPADDFVTAAMLNGGAPPDAATVAAFTAGTPLVRLNFAPGIVTGDNATTLLSSIDVSAITGTGRAELFADVDLAFGGAWAAVLDTNWFYVDTDGDGIKGEAGERRDVRLATFFNLLSTWDVPGTPIIGVRSNDPGRAYAVPEPSTIILFGVGLLGVAGVARRRNRK